MVQISWIGRNKSYTICHFCNSTSFPGGWPLHPLRGLFWRSSILLNKVQVHPLSITTHSSRDAALLLGGSPPGRIPSHQSGLKKHLRFSAEMHPLAVGKAFLHAADRRERAGQRHAAVSARSAWEEKQLSKTGHGHHGGGVSRSAGVEANLVCRHFY